MAAVFVLVGFVLGGHQLGILHPHPGADVVTDVTVVGLVVILFRDGLEVEGELLQKAWHLPTRKLAIAMPITAGIVAVAAWALVGLSWTQSFLLGALLSPTDPVLSSAVVTDPRVPRVVRHSLNLESGLNDGLALAPVLALAAALGEGHFVWWRFLLQNLGYGLAAGLVVGVAAIGFGRATSAILPRSVRGLLALGIAMGSYGLAHAVPHGNGFIAVFVCAIVAGVGAPTLIEDVAHGARWIVELAKLAVFVLFGSLLSFHALFNDGWAAVGVAAVTLLVARTVGVETALIGTGLPRAAKWFMDWFGPRGAAAVTYALLLLSRGTPGAARLFDLTALVVVCSAIAHGLTGGPGAKWLAERVAPDVADPTVEPA